MANKHLIVLIASLYWAIMGPQSWAIVERPQAWAITDELEVQALQDMYKSLNKPMRLEHWKSEGGDPCIEAWTGIQCYGSTIIFMKLHGLGLSGSLGFQLHNLKFLKHMDLSANKIEGPIPHRLPPNLTSLNLADNNFNQGLPYSLEKMKYLRHLNLSHNFLTGPLGDVFNGLENLKLMDLSFNSFTGDLPTSFKYLTNLSGLFLQNNNFTGSVIFLANLSLSSLNIEDNHFSAIIPEHFKTIPNLQIGGNMFHTEPNYSPRSFPSDPNLTKKNISIPSVTNPSAFKSYPFQTVEKCHQKKKSHAAGLGIVVGGVTVVAAFGALAVVFHRQRAHRKILRSTRGKEESMRSPPIGKVGGIDYTSKSVQASPNMSAFSSSPMITPSRLPPTRSKTPKITMRKSFSSSKSPIGTKAYTLDELQIATNNFSAENLIGQGSLGSVYRAEFPDGTALAVKSIKNTPLSVIEERQFFDVIKNVSRLRHPNITTMVGFCTEHRQCLVVYQYIENLSLDEALHCSGNMPLTWGSRLRIALGVARALNYIHSSFVPPVSHGNLKAANILLDEDLMPCVCDCGLATLRPIASNSAKIKGLEMAIADSGYTAPEHVQPGNGNTKADVYAFGVLLLELLTGRKPFDNSKPKGEQSLVRWASSKLHDSASLGQMVDPAITVTISNKSLSSFADIVSMCIQPEQEFRPPMSEIVESLASLLKTSIAAGAAEADPLGRFFRPIKSNHFGSSSVTKHFT